jgi:LmbE family N-acetylglucosaminyl deacetylase
MRACRADSADLYRLAAMKKMLKRMVQRGWRLVVPRRARNSLRLWLTLDMPDLAPTLIGDFAGGPVMVLAPHMDDEIIGPGGAVILHVRAGASVSFVFMTDGKAGDPAAGPGQASPQQIAQTRRAESQAAAAIVGVSDLVFLDGPDGALGETPAIVDALADLLRQRRPAIVYAPALTDRHPDHWATNRILRLALDRLDAQQLDHMLIRGYEVWSPLPANRMADITPVAQIKRDAIAVFVSQTRYVDYSWTANGLNQYRSMVHLRGRGYAEAFLETDVAEFRELFERICLSNPAPQG